MNGETAHSEPCPRSFALNKVIDLIIEIKSLEQKCVILKGLLQSDQLKQYMVTIGIYQSLSNCEMYEHGFL